MSTVVATLCVLAVASSVRDAAAGDPTLVYAGVNGGADFLPKSSVGSVLGVQASISRIDPDLDHTAPLLAWGAFADAAYITNRGAARFSIGPQAAFLTGTPFIVGLQPGLLTVVDHGRVNLGFSVSPAISSLVVFGCAWLYLRWDHELSGDAREDSLQVGLMVQLPVSLVWTDSTN